MANYQITHVRKPNRDSQTEHITHVQVGGKIYTREEIISFIERNLHSFYVQGPASISWVQIVRPMDGRAPFIRTQADSTLTDNLLILPPC